MTEANWMNVASRDPIIFDTYQEFLDQLVKGQNEFITDRVSFSSQDEWEKFHRWWSCVDTFTNGQIKLKRRTK